MNPARRRGIYWSGIGLLIFGAVLARWSIQHSSQLVNYQRLALMLPLLYAVPMLYVDTILDWSNASLRNRIRAGGAVFCALLLTVGAILWFIAAPLARG